MVFSTTAIRDLSSGDFVMSKRTALLIAAALASGLCSTGIAHALTPRSLGEGVVKAETAEVRVVFDRPAGAYAIGETVGLFVEAQKDAYLTVIAVSPKGEITKLFPNNGQADNFIKAGSRVQVPDPATGARLQVFGPVGKESIRVFSSSRPLTLFADLTQSGSGTFRSIEGGEPGLARSLNSARAAGAKISSDTVTLTTVETPADLAALGPKAVIPPPPAVVPPKPEPPAKDAPTSEKPVKKPAAPDNDSAPTAPSDAMVGKVPPPAVMPPKPAPSTKGALATGKPVKKPVVADDGQAHPAPGDELIGKVPETAEGPRPAPTKKPTLTASQQTSKAPDMMPKVKMPQLKMPQVKLPGGFGIQLPKFSFGRSTSPEPEAAPGAELIEVVEAKSPPCKVLVEDLNAAVAARDLQAAAAGADAIAVSADCGQFQVPAQRRLSALALAEAQSKINAGAPIEEYEPLLQLADKPQVLWQAAATLAEVHFAARRFAEAAGDYQDAIEIIKNEMRTPKAPDEATILDLIDRAGKARILAANGPTDTGNAEAARLVTAPKDHRSGLIGGVYSSDVRSIVPRSVPIPVTFDFNQATLTQIGQDAALELVEAVKEQRPDRIVLIGHADRRGSDAYNMKLSESRAQAVAAFLKQNGVETPIVTEARGATEPVGAPAGIALTEDDLDALNRRVEWRRQ
jgi:outer membrane protein OmpA-like peptidoglycan-associated protein